MGHGEIYRPSWNKFIRMMSISGIAATALTGVAYYVYYQRQAKIDDYFDRSKQMTAEAGTKQLAFLGQVIESRHEDLVSKQQSLLELRQNASKQLVKAGYKPDDFFKYKPTENK